MCISIHDMQLVISTHGVLQQANNAHRIMQEVESVHRKYAQCSTAGEECVKEFDRMNNVHSELGLQ